MKARKDTVRRLYIEAILKYFGCGDKKSDAYLKLAVKEVIHIAGKAPGDWVGEHGILEIYCENGIPNASDINDYSLEARELGIDTKNAVTYNSDKWFKIDAWVNLGLKAMGKKTIVHHEPFNAAVIGIYCL